MQQALAQAGQGAEPKGADRLRRLLNIGHVAFLLFLFAPPLTLCVAMAAEVNIAYFVGRSAWWAVLIIVTLFLAFAFFRVRRTKPVVLASIWVPAPPGARRRHLPLARGDHRRFAGEPRLLRLQGQAGAAAGLPGS